MSTPPPRWRANPLSELESEYVRFWAAGKLALRYSNTPPVKGRAAPVVGTKPPGPLIVNFELACTAPTKTWAKGENLLWRRIRHSGPTVRYKARPLASKVRLAAQPDGWQ